MVFTYLRYLQLALLLCLSGLFTAQVAEAAGLNLGSGTQQQQSPIIYTAHAIPTDAAQADAQAEAAWTAALVVLSAYYDSTRDSKSAPASWPSTLAINGITLDIQSAQPTSKPSVATSQRTPVLTTTSPTSSISSTRSSSQTSRTSMSSTASSTTHTSTATHNPTATRSATPGNDGKDYSSDVDRRAAIIIGTSLIFIALTLMLFTIAMVFRRKNSTGSFFKSARYSVASTMAGALQGGADDRASHQLETPAAVAALDEANEKGIASDDDHDVDAACPAPMIARDSTIAPASASLASLTWSSRPSVERLRTKGLVSRGLWCERDPRLHHSHIAHELDATPVTPGDQPLLSRQPSFSSFDADDITPRPTPGPFHQHPDDERSMVVIHSPTTSSSGIQDSEPRDITTSSSSARGESRDAITPIVTPVASYRDRRPVGLTLPSATNRFRDQRLAPFVHYNDESPERVSPLYRDKVSPLYRGNTTSASPNYRGNNGNGGGAYSPSPTPSHRGRVSPIVHYPSFGELSGFDFGSDEGTPRPSAQHDADGDDGWRRGGDTAFGRYEMG
ncbi:hypothetical protein DOTSEDRAFT_69053 [Dothistroma septosporum NZE10]|uniref:Mid2 domain-containing protein n=1 Tax=Dothistroma septosporum (strain NZE10 / CBS 128990) TaxID=675120 RepID=N1Q3W4_DOTSN|nr:hypothetical protein DOTSEDRAFT_69053 [Dothistroma septosporum NZE10]